MAAFSEQEQFLQSSEKRGALARLGAYVRLSGPGFLQSALTLGGGSLAAALFLGVIGGYGMLWVQLVSILLGAIMLAAISHVTLTMESSPFEGMRRAINPFLAWAWLGAAVFLNMVYALPQYALSYGAITENLLPGRIPNPGSLETKLLVTVLLGLTVTIVTLWIGGRAQRAYENVLKVLVAVVVLSFAAVVARLGLAGELPWGRIAAGFIPDLSQLTSPTGVWPEALAGIGDTAVRDWWATRIVDMQRERMIAAASSAVGINMAFLMPFALLARGWNRSFRGFSRFDLGFGLVLPFVLATGFVMIAATSQFYGQPWAGAEIREDGGLVLKEGANAGSFAELQRSLELRREAVPGVGVDRAEAEVASMLVPRTNAEFAGALQTVFGESRRAQLIFGTGALAMALSTLSLLVHISGIAFCEACGRPHRGWLYRLGGLVPVVGWFWPLLWGGASKIYLGIFAGVTGYVLLPLALISFLLMLNSRRLLGEGRPRGGARWAWNLVVGGALGVTGSAALWTAWNKTLFGFPLGQVFLGVVLVGTLWGHLHLRRRTASAPD